MLRLICRRNIFPLFIKLKFFKRVVLFPLATAPVFLDLNVINYVTIVVDLMQFSDFIYLFLYNQAGLNGQNVVWRIRTDTLLYKVVT